MSTRAVVFALMLAVAPSTAAMADAVVTRCQYDDEDQQAVDAGAAMNLYTAVHRGGRITFRCGGNATVRMRRSYTIYRSAEIDGGETITLDFQRTYAGFVGFDAAATLRLTGLTIRHAGDIDRDFFLPGTIASNDLTLVIRRSTIRQSSAPIFLTSGSVLVEDSTFERNTHGVIVAPSIEIRKSRFQANGGTPIKSRGGTVTIVDRSVISDHSEPSDFTDCQKLQITNTHFAGNKSSGRGGALRIGCHEASIEYSKFIDNGANEGGAIYVLGSVSKLSLRTNKFVSNSADEFGGAIAFASSVTSLFIGVRFTTFEDNRAKQGAAVGLERALVRGSKTLEATAVAFIRNVASEAGGGIYGADAEVRIARGFFLGNEAGKSGGAIELHPLGSRRLILANSLLARNRASLGSAFAGNGAQMLNVTIADNNGPAVVVTAPLQWPFFIYGLDYDAQIRFRNSILASNAGGNCGSGNSGLYKGDGPNMQYPDVGCDVSMPVTNPGLGVMYAPLIGSPAYGSGDNSVCVAQPINGRDVFDQRRPLLAACTIGAVEREPEEQIRRRLERDPRLRSWLEERGWRARSMQ